MNQNACRHTLMEVSRRSSASLDEIGVFAGGPRTCVLEAVGGPTARISSPKRLLRASAGNGSDNEANFPPVPYR
jgi:hypothetical protein